MRNMLAAGVAAILLTVGPAEAREAKPILQVSGDIAGHSAVFDLDALRDLPQATLVTSTVVTDGRHEFTGVLMRDLLERVGANGDRVLAAALNDYVVDIPMSDFRDYDVIIAYAMDGELLKRSDKGPLWIVYPRDAHAELQDIRYDYRWVWQLSGLKVQ